MQPTLNFKPESPNMRLTNRLVLRTQPEKQISLRGSKPASTPSWPGPPRKGVPYKLGSANGAGKLAAGLAVM